MEKLELAESQHLHWDRIMDDRAIQAGREARLLAAMLKELGGSLHENWQFDNETRVFYRMVPDAPTESPSKTETGVVET